MSVTSKKASMKRARARKSNMKLLLLGIKMTSLKKLQKLNHPKRTEMPAMSMTKNSMPANMQQLQLLTMVSPVPSSLVSQLLTLQLQLRQHKMRLLKTRCNLSIGLVTIEATTTP